MTICVFSIWDNHRSDKIKQLSENIKNVDKIVILSCLEANLRMMHDDFNIISQIAQKNNIPLHIVIGGHKDNPDCLKKQEVYYTVDVWDTFFLTLTFYKMLNSVSKPLNDEQSLDILNNTSCVNHDFKSLFISLNKAPKLHRAILMDMLSKHDLLHKGSITWREISNYQFKYWDQKLMFLDQTDESKLFDQELMPPNYNNSFMQLVTESQDEIFFLTEKTAIPLFFGKPFLVAGSQKFHDKLKGLGFKLYDEIFDYNFDDEKDMEKRYEGLVLNVLRLDKVDLKELYNKIHEKIVYNRNLAYKYALDHFKFPSVWNELAIPEYIELQPLSPYNINNVCKKYHDKFISRQI